MRHTLHLPKPPNPANGLLQDARKDRRKSGAAVEVTNGKRTKTMWVSMPTPPETRQVTPPPARRFEVMDWQARVWVDAPQWMHRQLCALPVAQLDALLRGSRHGLRRAKDTASTPIEYSELTDKLGRMIADGHLHLGGKTFKVSKQASWTDSYAVTGAKGTVRYTFEALLDVLREGRF